MAPREMSKPQLTPPRRFAGESENESDLSEVQSSRCPDPHFGFKFGHKNTRPDLRCGRHHLTTETLSGGRRRQRRCRREFVACGSGGTESNGAFPPWVRNLIPPRTPLLSPCPTPTS